MDVSCLDNGCSPASWGSFFSPASSLSFYRSMSSNTPKPRERFLLPAALLGFKQLGLGCCCYITGVCIDRARARKVDGEKALA